MALDGCQFNANPEQAARTPCLSDESPSKPHPVAACFFSELREDILRENLGSWEGVIVHETFFEHESNRVSSLDAGGVLRSFWRDHRLAHQSYQWRPYLADDLDGACLRDVVQFEPLGLAGL